jgi:sulfite exporter TauE/SafE
MDAALFASALALGLAGAPHCVAMCAAPCAAVTGGGGARAQWTFHLARAAGYAAAGALAAASVNSLGALGSVSPMFKPLWTAVHAVALTLGLWLALTGRQPAWVERIGRRSGPTNGTARSGWQVMQGPGRSAAAGALWVAWPCGLLQSAVLVAALADTPWTGAGVMAVFAMATGVGLTVAPWLWRRVGVGGGRLALSSTAGVRLAGVMLAAASGWVLTHGLWVRFAAYCGF